MYRADVLAALEKTMVVVLSASVMAIVVFIVASAVAATTARPELRLGSMVGGALVFGLFGMVMGMTMAASRTPAVGAVLPGVLTFIGAVAVFAVTREKADPPVVMAAVAGFVVLFFMGTVLGAFERQRAQATAEIRRLDIDLLRHEANVQLAIDAYRRSLGLSERAWNAAPAPAEPATP